MLGAMLCEVCSSVPVCSKNRGCWCVVGVGGNRHCHMSGHSSRTMKQVEQATKEPDEASHAATAIDTGGTGGAGGVSAPDVTFSEGGCCSLCKMDNTDATRKRRRKANEAAGTTSPNEVEMRRSMGMRLAPPLTKRRRDPVSFADAPPSVWQKLLYWYVEKLDGGMPPNANRAKWHRVFEKMATNLNVVKSIDRKDSGADRVERWYVFLHKNIAHVLNKKHRLPSAGEPVIDWVTICGCAVWS